MIVSQIVFIKDGFATLFIRRISRQFKAEKAHSSGGQCDVPKTVVFGTGENCYFV